jgi:predicted transcriptional regulator
MATTIQISDDVKKVLDKMRIFQRETYNELIMNMLEDNMRINEKTRKELDEARKEIKLGKTISHEEVKKRLGL